mmetsp:Transcript_32000/g.53783  ORF Transcript_32000/g.53783 Transcript_32000/m.53783 type:complete len:202 (+) Transcript_32000:443-1048(+)
MFTFCSSFAAFLASFSISARAASNSPFTESNRSLLVALAVRPYDCSDGSHSTSWKHVSHTWAYSSAPVILWPIPSRTTFASASISAAAATISSKSTTASSGTSLGFLSFLVSGYLALSCSSSSFISPAIRPAASCMAALARPMVILLPSSSSPLSTAGRGRSRWIALERLRISRAAASASSCARRASLSAMSSSMGSASSS